jgi:hypothetical protein
MTGVARGGAMRSEPGQSPGDLAVATLDGVKVALCGGWRRMAEAQHEGSLSDGTGPR